MADNEVLAHVHDPGRLRELLVPGARLGVREIGGDRKTAYDVVLVRSGGRWVAIYSTLANRLIHAALERHALPELGSYGRVTREVAYRHSRFDFRLEGTPPMWLEVKTASLVDGRTARFPDAPTERGRRHLEHLTRAVALGERAAVFFVVARSGVERLLPNDRTDPAFGTALRKAAAAGVKLFARTCRVGPAGITLAGRIPVILP